MNPDAFLQTIRDNPDDDGPRLVYADWLEERGDPLGEFIRVQCELARAAREGESPNRKSLRQREEELLSAHRWEWLGKLTRWLHDDSFVPCFGRGFVERVKIGADILVGDHELIGELCPLMRSMTLYRAAEFWEGLALCPLLSRLRKLEIADWLEYDQALVLANSRLIAELKSLSVWVRDYPQSYEVGLALIDAPGLSDVKLLHLYDSTHARELPDEETRWRNRVEDELNERTMADRGEIFHVVSSSDRRFLIQCNADRGYHAGTAKTGLQVLAVSAGHDLLHVVRFDNDGKRLGSESRSLRRVRKFQSDFDEPATFREQRQYLRDEYSFEPNQIRVQQFIDPCGLAVHQFPSQHWSLIANPELQAEFNTLIAYARTIANWIEQQNAVLDWGSEIWLSGDGRGL
jgi:uncharacterized protein (TIGR02996 family)